MKLLLFGFALLAASAPSIAAPSNAPSSSAASLAPKAPKGWHKYDGPWFSVYVPRGWKATPKKQLPAVDSAIFTSPDGMAKFTVFSPQWNGTPPDIKPLSKTEVQVAKKVTVRKEGTSTLHATWLTFKNKDGKWTRMVVDRENATLGSRLTFGFAYRDLKTYNRYKQSFETFKKSLQQFAD